MPKGYLGKILWVNLLDLKISIEYPDEKYYRDFIGGYGIGAKILFRRLKPGIDPLGPDNVLGFMSGPLTGTQAIGGSRYTVVGKSPLTGGWGDANSGGYFGPQLRFAGFDGVFFEGISDHPVYLFINNGAAELKDAAHLWGKDTHDTEYILKSELGRDTKVACIGPAGEKLSLIACIMNEKGRAAGRSGLGAVMGSKKLKAIAVSGNQKIPVFDEEKVDNLRKEYLSKLVGASQYFKQSGGTAAVTLMHARMGDTPIKNWGGIPVVEFPNADPLGGEHILKLMEKKYACYKCPVVCGGILKAGSGEYKWEAGTHKPEYETLGMFGGSCQNNNLESIIMVNDICNRFGVDTISAGATMAFTMECYENGLINQKDTDGIEMTWGNHRSIVAMTEKLVRREGFGDLIADGVRVAAEKIGKGADKYAMHIGGQEYPAHHPLVDYRFATTYRLDPTPGRHTQGGEAMHPPGLLPIFDKTSVKGRGKAHKIGSDFNHVVYSSGLCLFVYGSYPDVNLFIEFMNAVTGWKSTVEEFLKSGEKIANLRQAFNIREGLNAVKFKLSGRLLGEPLHKEGPLAGKNIDADILANEYLAEMDWDRHSAKPSKNKLLELGLTDVAKELWP
jgi:aldehyde:ferredoxin oxidoreductase